MASFFLHLYRCILTNNYNSKSTHQSQNHTQTQTHPASWSTQLTMANIARARYVRVRMPFNFVPNWPGERGSPVVSGRSLAPLMLIIIIRPFIGP
ncbi:hypothetical protein [robinz microvirus RP_34]|nr:hypothetical protein [robinz microvirus RP_34]